MLNELKPCPFCGGKPHFEHYSPSWCFPWAWLFKHTCGGGKSGNNKRIAIYASGFDTKEEAAEVWNRRANDEQAD